MTRTVLTEIKSGAWNCMWQLVN